MKPKTHICKICFKVISPNFNDLILDTYVCAKCFNELDVKFNIIKIEGITYISIFNYDEHFKTLLFHLKGLKDVVLAPLFLERFVPYLILKFRNYYLVPAPSTKESDRERGFNHVIEIFKRLKRPFLHVIAKKVAFKQSDLNYTLRQKVKDKLIIHDGHKVSGKNILIVDDIKTTGATIKAMINLIKPYNPRKIVVLTLAATTLSE